MKKRILLSLVSFFAMTAMWASLIDAYKITVTSAANGKTNATAELTLNMDNKLAIGTWQTTLVLPEGVTFESVAIVNARYPEGYEAELTTTPNEDGSVTISCEGAEGVALTGTAGAIATVTVKIGAIEPGDYTVIAKNTFLTEVGGTIHENKDGKEYTWTIEQGEEPGTPGDLNGDEKVDIADGVAVLDMMANDTYDAAADLNNDGKVDIADFVSILDLMAQAE
jgi:hypothetical protein